MKKGGVPENLRPVRNTDEAKKRGKNGGIASGVSRRKKRNMKEAVRLLMDMPISFDNVSQSMKEMGIQEEDLTNQMAVVVSMYKEAMSGNVRAAEFLRETLGNSAEAMNRAERLKMDKERLKMEQERLKMQKENAGASDNDGLPVIINVRPDRKDDVEE